MKIIVDTTIVFSAILNPTNNIANLLIRSKSLFEFYSVDYLLQELSQHKQKIIKLGGYSSSDYKEAVAIATKRITFFRDVLIPNPELLKAEKILEDIDKDDTIFLALSFHLNAPIWTGDKNLINGLKSKGIDSTITTKEMKNLSKHK